MGGVVVQGHLRMIHLHRTDHTRSQKTKRPHRAHHGGRDSGPASVRGPSLRKRHDTFAHKTHSLVGILPICGLMTAVTRSGEGDGRDSMTTVTRSGKQDPVEWLNLAARTAAMDLAVQVYVEDMYHTLWSHV